MTQATLNLRIDAKLKADFLEAAKAMDRNGSQLIRDFMRETVQRQHDAWFREQVKAGIVQADGGRFSLANRSKQQQRRGVNGQRRKWLVKICRPDKALAAIRRCTVNLTTLRGGFL